MLTSFCSYFPGHIHAFYLEYVYYRNRDEGVARPAPGVYSSKVQTGGRQVVAPAYGTMQ